MTWRFTYSHAIEGSFIASEPSGWDKCTIGLERHPDFNSLVEYFKGSMGFYGSNGDQDGGRDWILNIEKIYGADAEVDVKVEIDEYDDGHFVTIFTGQQAIGLLIETLDQDHMVECTFTQNDFWTRIINRYDSQVDLKSVTDIDGNPVDPAPSFTLPLPAQKLIKKYEAYLKYNTSFQVFDITNDIFLIGFDTESLKEITEQSAITFTITTGADGSRADATDPKSYNQIVPYFNPIDDGDFIIKKLKFTMSGMQQDDPNYAASADFMRAKNGKFTKMTNIDFYIQQNVGTPIKLNKSYRAVANYVSNDGFLEDLYVGTFNPFVTDYELPADTELLVNKYDAIKLFGIYNDEFTFPYKDRNGRYYIWGTDGWSHDSGYEQMAGCKGSYQKYRGSSSIHDDSNQGDFAYGGLFDPVGSFPITIDDEGGTGLAIKQRQWFVAGTDGHVVGGTIAITKGQVMQARVDNPADTLTDWHITDLTPFEGLEAYGADNAFNIEFNTTRDLTNTDAFLTHDVGYGILDRIAGQSDLFYSDYLGNQWTKRVYGDAGCGSLKANMKGLHLRGYLLADKPVFSSLQDWFKGINPIDNLGMGYELVDGVMRFRVEEVDHFFDDSGFSILISNVWTIRRYYDPNVQYRSIQQGYQKWQSQDSTGIGIPSGIDDAQTSQTRNSFFKKIGKTFQNLSSWIAASLTIETTVRTGNKESSNYTYDDDMFVIILHSNGDGTFRPATNENFSSITGLLNPETRYNSAITPARNFIRWLNVYSIPMQKYLSSVFQFGSAEGNFNMQSEMSTSCPGDDNGNVVNEKGDIAPSNEFLHLDELYDIQHYISLQEYETMVLLKNRSVGISMTKSGHKKMFVKSFELQASTGLFKATFKAKEHMDIIVPDTYAYVTEVSGSPTPPHSGHYFEEPYFEDEFE